MDDYNDFLSQSSIVSIDAMMVRLRPSQHAGLKKAFQNVMSLHIRSVGWEQFDMLWKAFGLIILAF